MSADRPNSRKRSSERAANLPDLNSASARRARQIVLVAGVAAVLVRVVCIVLAPLNSYAPDHRDNMTWSDWAYTHGPTAMYDLTPRQPLLERQRDPRTGQVAVQVTTLPHGCNYPPLSIYVFWCQGWLWHALDHDVVTLDLPPRAVEQLGRKSVSGRVLETFTARLVQAAPSIVADLLLAWGVVWIVRFLRPDSWLPPASAYALVLLAPPVFLDSAFWGQTDSWVAAGMVWTLYFLLRERLAWAGVCWGAALLIKPQAILMGPVFVFVFLALRFRAGGTWRAALRMWRAAVGAVVAIAVIAAPFMIADRDRMEGPLRWFERSYRATIGAEVYARTTMNAFNVWWLGYAGAGGAREALDSTVRVAGMTKDTIGAGLLALAVLGAGWLCGRKWGWAPISWLACAYLVTLAAFVLPTRVHERYIYYALVMLMALTAVRWRLWIAPLVLLLIVGTFEMLAFRWVNLRDAGVRGASMLLAFLTLAAFVYSYAATIPRAARAAR